MEPHDPNQLFFAFGSLGRRGGAVPSQPTKFGKFGKVEFLGALNFIGLAQEHETHGGGHDHNQETGQQTVKEV